MKICMLTSGHNIYDNRIYYKEVLSLKKRYDDIYIVAPGEKDFITEDGIKIRCFKKKKNWHDRIRPMKDLYRIGKEINADIYHAHEPDSYQVATKLKKHIGAKIIYDSHEYYPEAFAEHFKGFEKLATKLIYLYEKNIAKKADYIITVNKLLVDKFNKYNKNVALIPNYPVMNNKILKKEIENEINFIYVGGLREDRGIFKVLQAIKEVKYKDCNYYFIGPFGTKEFEEKTKNYVNKKLKDKNIIFTGSIPHLQVFEYLKKANVGLVLLQPNNWRYINSEPVKLFEYMLSETAVIASDFPMMANIVKKTNCGVLVNPESIEDISQCIDRLCNNIREVNLMGENGVKAIKETYNWNVCEKKLLDIYNQFE